MLRAIAVFTDNEWKNLSITGFLSYDNPDNVRRELEEEYGVLSDLGVTSMNDVLILYEVTNANELPRVVDELNSGKIAISNQVIGLRALSGQVRVEDSVRFLYRDLYEYPGISLEWYSQKTVVELKKVNDVEEQLKSYGYASLDELCVQWLKMPCRSYSLEATIAVPIYLANTKIGYDSKRNVIQFRTKLHRSLASKLKLVIALAERKDDTFIPVENIIKGFRELNAQKVFPQDFVIVNLDFKFRKSPRREDVIRYRIMSKLGILESGEVAIDKLLPKAPDNLSKLFTMFIDFDTMWKIIIGEESVGEHIGRRQELSFQRAIAWFFTLLGFRVIEFEGTKFKTFEEVDGTRREVDIIMFDDLSKRLYIADCSIRAPEPKKIDDIANARESLLRVNVYTEPLIIVREYAQETKRNVRRVRVLDREDLEKALNYLRQGNIAEARRAIGF